MSLCIGGAACGGEPAEKGDQDESSGLLRMGEMLSFLV